MPIVAIAIIVLVSLGILLGRQTRRGDILNPFKRDPLLVLYLSWDDAEQVQLFRAAVGGEPEQLTQTTADILHYAPSPDGQQIAYSTGSELWLVNRSGRSPDQLLICTPAQCDHIVWHPDGRRLLYERRQSDAPVQLWWLAIDTGETIPLQIGVAGPSRAASFSADGKWVSYAVAPEQGLEFYHFEDGRHFQIPSSLGTPAIWRPTLPGFLYRSQQIVTFHGRDDADHQGHSHDYALASYLFLANVDDPAGVNISGDGVVDDDSPAWSPDGRRIVFGRKPPGAPVGGQLWLAQPDGRAARPLTDEPLIHHGVPSWSPDGRFILYQRYDTGQPDSQPAIWLLELATGAMTEIAAPGFQPVWGR